VARTAEETKLYRVLVGNTEGKMALGRPRCRWGMGSEWILGRMTVECGGLVELCVAEKDVNVMSTERGNRHFVHHK